MQSPDRFRPLDGLGWLTTPLAALTGGFAWLYSPALIPMKPSNAGAGWSRWFIPIMLLSFAAAIAVHEAGHWLAARRLGYPVTAVKVSLFKGAVEMDAEEMNAGDEALITVAGPLANIIAFLAIFAQPLIGDRTIADALTCFAMANAGVGVANLMPFRLDQDSVSDGERLLALAFPDV